MFGIPTQTNAEVMDTVHMIRHIKPEYICLPVFTPFRGADLSEYCRENNLILVDSYAKYNPGKLTPIIKGVDYGFIAHALEEVWDLSYLQKISHRLRGAKPVQQTVRTLVKHQPFKALLPWLRGRLPIL